MTTAEHSTNPCDFALVTMLGLLGLRIFEATGSDIEDLGEQHGHRVPRVRGKGDKVVLVPLPPAVGRALERAIDVRTTGASLLTSRGTRMDRHCATRRLRRLSEEAGVRLPRMHPHMLRHTFVTTMLDAGVDLRDVQIAARHADPRTTMRYDRARKNLDRHPNYILAAYMARVPDRSSGRAELRTFSDRRIRGETRIRLLGRQSGCLVGRMNFDGMWTEPDTDPREALEPGRGEKAVLGEYLDRYRMTFELKCQGLTAEQLATRSVPPSTLSLLGMIRHLARVEHSWTRRVFEGQIELLRLYRTEEDPDLDFNQAVADDEVVADAWDTWRREVAHARAVYADLDLDAPVNVHGKEAETRDIVVHLVEEYARHVGHADLLRECIDGRTGQ